MGLFYNRVVSHCSELSPLICGVCANSGQLVSELNVGHPTMSGENRIIAWCGKTYTLGVRSGVNGGRENLSFSFCVYS